MYTGKCLSPELSGLSVNPVTITIIVAYDCILSCFHLALLTFDRNTQRTRLLLTILIHFRPTSSKNKRWKIMSIFIYLYPSTLRQMSVQIQFALKILKMRIKISSLAIVITEFDAIGEYNYVVVILL